MKTYFNISALFLLALLFSCIVTGKGNAIEPSVIGRWKIKQVLANDQWGGPLTWRNATRTTQIEFTSDAKFYRREDMSSSLISVGSYTVLPDSTLKIVTKDASGNDFNENLNYVFDKNGHLILRKNQFEGLVGEKFEIFR
jgi:hypothetical protein